MVDLPTMVVVTTSLIEGVDAMAAIGSQPKKCNTFLSTTNEWSVKLPMMIWLIGGETTLLVALSVLS
jgi:hypothetical protein